LKKAIAIIKLVLQIIAYFFGLLPYAAIWVKEKSTEKNRVREQLFLILELIVL